MSILTKEDRRDLVWSMRTSLLEQVRSGVLTEGKKAAAENFIINEATYEQLLNLAFNPERETNYKSLEVLEKVALETYAAVLENEECTAEEKAKEKKEEKKEEKAEEKKEEAKEKKEEAKKESSVFEAIEIAVIENEILNEGVKKAAVKGLKAVGNWTKEKGLKLWDKMKGKESKAEFIKKHHKAAIAAGFATGGAAGGAGGYVAGKKKAKK